MKSDNVRVIPDAGDVETVGADTIAKQSAETSKNRANAAWDQRIVIMRFVVISKRFYSNVPFGNDIEFFEGKHNIRISKLDDSQLRHGDIGKYGLGHFQSDGRLAIGVYLVAETVGINVPNFGEHLFIPGWPRIAE